MKQSLAKLLPIFDILAAPFVIVAAHLLKLVRRIGVQRLPLSKAQLMRIGVFPNHYEVFSRTCPYLARDREPGSLYIERHSR